MVEEEVAERVAEEADETADTGDEDTENA